MPASSEAEITASSLNERIGSITSMVQEDILLQRKVLLLDLCAIHGLK
jgi:hypothetical protein